MVDKNDSLLREVDEELRRERMEKLWDKYGIYLLGIAGLFVALVGGYKVLDARTRAAAEAGGAQFESALSMVKAGKADEAAKAFAALSASDKPGYAALAELNAAGAFIKTGKTAEALAVFEKLSANPGADPLIKGFAQLQAASLRLDEADFTELKNRLTPLMAETSPWKSAATEMLGTAAIKAGKLDEARAVLAPLLADRRLSRTGVERVRTLMSVVAAMETGQAPTSPVPASTSGDKPAGDKPAGDKPAGDKPAGDKPADDKSAGGKPAGGKSAGDKSAGDKPAGGKSAGDKSAGDKPAGGKPAGDKSSPGVKAAGDKK